MVSASMTTVAAPTDDADERQASWQFDLLDDADPLIGIEVNLPHRCQCGHDFLYTGPGCGPHCASLHCARCQRHCGWLSNESAKFICSVIEHFGRPTEPVRVRLAKPSIAPNSAPPGADAV
jgi:hypothetical protein